LKIEDKVNKIIAKHWGLKEINLSVIAEDIQKLLKEERESSEKEFEWQSWTEFKNIGPIN